MIDDFVKTAKEENISIISQEIFEHDPASRVENLKVILCFQLGLAFDQVLHGQNP